MFYIGVDWFYIGFDRFYIGHDRFYIGCLGFILVVYRLSSFPTGVL